MPDIVTQLDTSILGDLKTRWNGRLPTWEEFRAANKSGRVRANKSIGMKAINLQGIPRSFWFLFGIVTPWGMYIVPLACAILAILGIWGWWTIIVGLFASWFLYKVTLEGAADAIRHGAAENELLYQALVSKGAFLFSPPAPPPAEPNTELIGALGELMERYPTALLDTARLPASKQKMKDVIKEVWREQPKLRGVLTQAYLHLSQFQDGIGDAVLDCKLPAPASHDLEAIRREAAELSGPKGENFRQWIMWSKVSAAEMEILAQEWEKFQRSNAA